VQFGLQFDPATAPRDDGSEEDAADAQAENAEKGESPAGEQSGEKVVSLDAFRKKP
jgi:hypothetical protein